MSFSFYETVNKRQKKRYSESVRKNSSIKPRSNVESSFSFYETVNKD